MTHPGTHPRSSSVTSGLAGSTGPARGALRLVACAILVAGGLGGALVVAPMLAHAAASGIAFPGPARGVPSTQTPAGTAFVTRCNAQATTAPATVGGATVMTGTAVSAEAGCGTAVLPLAVPGQGHFHARFGVSDADTTGQQAVVRLRVLDRSGFTLSTDDVTARRGSPSAIDVDVTHAVAVELDFLKSPQTLLYDIHLTGTARALAPVQMTGSGLPAGATPINMSAVAVSCNAQKAPATKPLTVSGVGLPAASSVSGTGCGAFTLAFPAAAHGTLALRYGADDTSVHGNEVLFARGFDARGRLLRKATGVAAIGAGLQPLWLDLTGVRSVQLAIDGGTDVVVDITAVGVVPGRIAPYVASNLVQTGGSAHGSVAIDPQAFSSRCNSLVGNGDVALAQQPIPGGTYLATYSCGSASLFFCCTSAEGIFHARFGVPDSDTSGKPATVTVIVKDKDDHVLRRHSYSALGGNPGVRIDVDIHRASIISFVFGGASGLLYDLRLSGGATISERIFAPSEPPTATRGGVAIDPHDFTVHCNAGVASTDQRVVGDTTLESWALLGEACGEADLALDKMHYPRHDLYARVGIALGEPSNTIATFHINLLDGAGKVVRSTKVSARYGYGTQPVHVSLRGGTTVQILWDTQTLSGSVVYALTAA